MKQIVSPHIDDAFLSLGGSILNWLSNGEKVKIIYIFTRSSWTNTSPISNIKYPSSISTVTTLRKEEESNLQSATGHQVSYLDWYENGHRGKKSAVINLLCRGSIPVPEKKMIGSIEQQLIDRLDRNKTTYFPLGLGKWVHPDHAITRSLGLSLLNKGYKIALYEDLPYYAHINENEIRSNFSDHLIFTPVYEEVDIDRKVNLLERYQSQMSQEWLNTVRDHSLSLRNKTPFERYWSINQE